MNDSARKGFNSHQAPVIRKERDNPTRNLTYSINLTLDGCCDHTKTIADEELLEYYTQLLRDVDVAVYGRKTYQLMVPYWPDVAKLRGSAPCPLQQRLGRIPPKRGESGA